MFKFIEQTLASKPESKVLKSAEYTRGKLFQKDVILGKELSQSQGKYNYDIYKKFPLSEGTVAFGSTARWKIYGPHKIEEMFLQLTLNQMTADCCYLPAPMLIEYINIFHKNVEIQRIYPDDQYLKYEMTTDYLYKGEKEVFLGVQDRATRVTTHTAGNTTVNIPIRTYIQDLDLYMDVLASGEFYVEVKFKNAERCVESGTALSDPTMADVKINSYSMIVKMQEYNFSLKPMLMNTSDRVRRILVPDHYRISIPSGQTSIQRVLHDIKPSNVAYFMFWLTDAVQDYDASALTVDTQNKASVNYDFTLSDAITSFQLKDRNGREFKFNFIIENDFYNGYLQHDWFEKNTHHEYVKGKNFRVWSFSDNPVNAHDGSDFSSFPMTGEEELHVTLSNATSGTKTLNLLVWSYAILKFDGSERTIKVLK